MEQFQQELRIPKDRIAVLLGSKGETKAALEKATSCKIEVDSGEGDVFIDGQDAVDLMGAKEAVLAIGRGFNPEIAMQLLKHDYAFELISLQDYNKHKNHQIRLKGRVIGKEGRSRKLIEEYCDVNITIYGKTIGIIGEVERCNTAKRAVEMLLEGAPHATVYKWLEKKRRAANMASLSSNNFKEEVNDDFKEYVE